jgi:hypothetical protein
MNRPQNAKGKSQKNQTALKPKMMEKSDLRSHYQRKSKGKKKETTREKLPLHGGSGSSPAATTGVVRHRCTVVVGFLCARGVRRFPSTIWCPPKLRGVR